MGRWNCLDHSAGSGYSCTFGEVSMKLRLAFLALLLAIATIAVDGRQVVIIAGPPPPLPPGSAPPAPPAGDTYYVRLDGSNTNCAGTANASDASTPTTACAWQTIDFAADSLSIDPNDRIRVQAGDYGANVSPSRPGTAGNPVTFIADGAVSFCVLSLNTGDNYIRFIGFTIDTDSGGCVKATATVNVATGGFAETMTGIEFWNNTIQDATIGGLRQGHRDTRGQNWIVIGNTFRRMGANIGFGDGGSSAAAISVRGDNNIYAYNNFSQNDPDVWLLDGSYNRLHNNYIESWPTDGGHGDIIQTGSSIAGFGQKYNLFEANWNLGGMGNTTDEHGILLQDQGLVQSCPTTPTCGEIHNWTFRRNVWHDFDQATFSADTSATDDGIFDSRLFHETFVDTVRVATSPLGAALLRNIGANGTPPAVNGFFMNNLLDDAWSTILNTNIRGFEVDTNPVHEPTEWTAANGNLAYRSGVTLTFHAAWNAQASKQSNADPAFVDRANDNFTLSSSSAARDRKSVV